MDSNRMMRVYDHPILGKAVERSRVTIKVDGQPVSAVEGEPIAATLMAAGKMDLRYTTKQDQPRGVFCAIGRCTDCMMTVDGIPNVRTCVTPVQEGMVVETQKGEGKWEGINFENS
jgi:predicted molibdopterin-dependent oxidoreductase YjgC